MSDENKQTEEKPLSYTDKLVKLFKEHEQTDFSTDEVLEVIEQFREEQSENRRNASNKLPFGKYRYKTLESVAKFDMRYLKWLSKQKILDNFGPLKTNILKITSA